MPMPTAWQDQMPMHAGVASQKLAMRVSQKPAGRWPPLNQVPPEVSVGLAGRHRFSQNV